MSVNSFSPEHLHQKLDGLNLTDKKTRMLASSKPSLLSSSLANERLNNSLSHNSISHSISGSVDSSEPSYDSSLRDHPEPELLATSVGKDSEGRLIPSSSTISLLSLNSQHPQTQSHHVQASHASPGNTSFNTSPYATQYSQFEDYQATSTPGYGSVSGANRISGIRSRNSITHLTQKRFETYAKMTSPPPGSTPGSTPGPASLTATDMVDHSTSQSIPINNKLIPDSPNLDPTSLNGSPSRFWLSSQTPPRSLGSSYKKMSALTQLSSPQQQLQSQQSQQVQAQHLQSQLYQLPQQTSQRPLSQPQPSSLSHSQQPTSQLSAPHHVGISQTVNSQLTQARPMSIPLTKKGSDSPTLYPVQTPQEEMPMTPLYLNNEFQGNNYFSLDEHIREVDEPEETNSDDEMND